MEVHHLSLLRLVQVVASATTGHSFQGVLSGVCVCVCVCARARAIVCDLETIKMWRSMSNLGFCATKKRKYHNIYTFRLHVNYTLS